MATKDKDQEVTFDKSNMQKMYVEGVSQVLMGYPVMKVYFHDSVNTEQVKNKKDIESRRVALELTIPTSSLLEFATNVLRVFQDNKAQAEIAANTSRDIFVSALSGLNLKFPDE